MSKLYIIIVNYNSWGDTLECLESLKNNLYRDFQIILIDNNSQNNSTKKLLSKFYDLKIGFKFYNLEEDLLIQKESCLIKNATFQNPIIFIHSDINRGFAGGNNIALRYLMDKKVQDDSRIFLLNPDTTIENDALLNLMNIKERVFISGCHIKSYDDHSISYYGAYRFNIPLGKLIQIKNPISESKLIDYIHGGALFTNMATLNIIGLMPSEYFLYWEETDWCYNAKQNGVPLIICENAIVYDKVGTSIGRGTLAYYYYSRNGFIFYEKYFKKYILLLFFSQLARLGVAMLKGRRKIAKGYFLGIRDYIQGKKG